MDLNDFMKKQGKPLEDKAKDIKNKNKDKKKYTQAEYNALTLEMARKLGFVE